MIPFLRDALYTSLASAAKQYYQVHHNLTPMEVSLRNARRIARLREKKMQEIEAANMLAQVKGHKEKSRRLKAQVQELHKRITDHTSGTQELVAPSLATSKVKSLSSLQLSLKAVQKLAVDMHDARELSASQWETLSAHIRRLAHLIKVQKARFERDAKLLEE